MLTRVLLGWAVVAAMAAGVVAAEPATFALKGENTKIAFVGSKKDGSHTGGFKKLVGTASLKDPASPATLSLSVTIDTDSLEADDAKLTAHLKSPDFFDVKRFPEAKFVASKVEAAKDAKDGFQVTGDLTLHGVTKKLTFPATISTAGGLKLDAKFTLDRNEWGISFGKGQINDAVAMTVSIDAKK